MSRRPQPRWDKEKHLKIANNQNMSNSSKFVMFINSLRLKNVFMPTIPLHHTHTVELTELNRHIDEIEMDSVKSEDGEEEDKDDELTPGDLLAFAWQISKGMVCYTSTT